MTSHPLLRTPQLGEGRSYEEEWLLDARRRDGRAESDTVGLGAAVGLDGTVETKRRRLAYTRWKVKRWGGTVQKLGYTPEVGELIADPKTPLDSILRVAGCVPHRDVPGLVKKLYAGSTTEACSVLLKGCGYPVGDLLNVLSESADGRFTHWLSVVMVQAHGVECAEAIHKILTKKNISRPWCLLSILPVEAAAVDDDVTLLLQRENAVAETRRILQPLYDVKKVVENVLSTVLLGRETRRVQLPDTLQFIKVNRVDFEGILAEAMCGKIEVDKDKLDLQGDPATVARRVVSLRHLGAVTPTRISYLLAAQPIKERELLLVLTAELAFLGMVDLRTLRRLAPSLHSSLPLDDIAGSCMLRVPLYDPTPATHPLWFCELGSGDSTAVLPLPVASTSPPVCPSHALYCYYRNVVAKRRPCEVDPSLVSLTSSAVITATLNEFAKKGWDPKTEPHAVPSL